MSTELQNRLNQFEVIPPEICWQTISGRLDVEYNLADSTAPVPIDSWINIARVLDTGEDIYVTRTETETPVVPMRGNWLKKVAAVFILAIGVAFLYRYVSLPGNPGDASTSGASVLKLTPQSNAALVPSVADSRVESGNSRSVARINRASKRGRSSNNNAASFNEADLIAEAAPDMRYASIENAERPVVSNPISVSSEPIRDADGNIIMDEKLVSAPDNNYVTVTGPNGEQTRMSKKFFRALSYLNSDSQKDSNMGVMLQESALWKWLFQEWRTRLIQEPTFIPSSTNFLDILEMKDLLNDQL
jgi:hypothetical protein